MLDSVVEIQLINPQQMISLNQMNASGFIGQMFNMNRLLPHGLVHS